MAGLRIGIAHRADESEKHARRKTDIQEITEVLEHAGYKVFSVPVDGSRECLARLAQVEADLLFNLVEGFGDDDTKEPYVAAYLELLGLRYTGSNARALSLAMDKALTKKVLQFHQVLTPRFVTVYRGRLDWAHDVEFPVIVKPLREDGSIGINFSAVVNSIKELMERIDELHADFDHPVLIEQYIDGQEIYVGVIGNDKPEAFPAVELTLTHLPPGTPRIAGAEVKWDESSPAYKGSKYKVPADLPAQVAEAVQLTAVHSFHALELRDYARFDFRITKDHQAYLIEANPNPYLHSRADFMKGARASGRTQPATILEIVELALARYGPG